MKLIGLLSLVLLSVSLASSQAPPPPPPPPPLIYAAPDKTDIKEFVDFENKFKVAFPGIPVRKVDSGHQRIETTYKVYRKGSNSSVTVLVLNQNMESRSAEFFDTYKQHLADLTPGGPSRFPSTTVIVSFDRETEIAGMKGREFGFESDYHFTQVALFIVGNRIFEIRTDVTNWHILTKYYPEIVKTFYSEADRFRNSFSFVNEPR